MQQQTQISLETIYKKLVELEKSMKKMDNYVEDLEFARQTQEAWAEIDAGKGKTYTKEEFLQELKTW